MSFRADPLKKKANYYSIKESSFRIPTSKDDPEAIHRPYTNPKTGEEGTAHEKGFEALFGVISDISFPESTLKDGTVLRNLHISLGEDDNGTQQIISVPIDSRYATDFLKRLPKMNLNEEVKLKPYDFEKDGPRQVGIAVYARNTETDVFDVPIDSKFFVEVSELNGEKTYTHLHGFPEVTDEDREDWAFYFKKVNKFLVKYAKDKILPQFQDQQFVKKHEVPKIPNSKEEEDGYPNEKINPDDIPF